MCFIQIIKLLLFITYRCRAEWFMFIWEADPLRPESGNKRPQSESHHPGRETQPSLPGSSDQHLPYQSLSGSFDQGTVPWNPGQHHLHDACWASAAGGGSKNCGQWEHLRPQWGAKAGSGEGVSPAGGLWTERGLCCRRGHGPLWPMLNKSCNPQSTINL